MSTDANSLPRPLVIVDGDKKIQVIATAANMIRMIAEQQLFFNAPYNAGVVHFHFSGKDHSANLKTDLDIVTSAALLPNTL